MYQVDRKALKQIGQHEVNGFQTGSMTSKLFRIAVACALLATAREALAEDFKAGNIVISHPWSRATPVGAQIGAGYLVIENRGTVSDRVLGGSVEVCNGFRDSRCRA